MAGAFFLNACGIASPLGLGKQANADALFAGRSGIAEYTDYLPNSTVGIGMVTADLPPVPTALKHYDSRNNRLLQHVLLEIKPELDAAIAKFGADRIAVILGTSTSGIEQGEHAYAHYKIHGTWPGAFHYRQQEISSPSTFAAYFLGLTGPAYTVATACASSGKVFASARRLIETGIVDAAIVGGVDTLCQMTVQGFSALEILSPTRGKPFSANRDGITIGEGAALFLMSREPGPVQFLGVGETADAYHVTAPDPEGRGAKEAMRKALDDAKLTPMDIDYINLHGTGTPLNDATEGHAVAAIFGRAIPCSSTKGITGHMLGAAGGCEAAFLWLTLNPETNPGTLPPHIWDDAIDPALPALNFVSPGTALPETKNMAMLSNSFGFGGSNVSIILGRAA